MKTRTEDLIAELAEGTTPVLSSRVPQRLAIALVLGAVAVLIVQIQTVGVRADATTAWMMIGAKLAACFIVAAIWLWLLRQLAVPGNERRTQWALAVGSVGVVTMVASFNPVGAAGLLSCVKQVLLLAIPAFAIVAIALRNCAPTNLTETGIAAGMLAGALGTIGYSLGCMTDEASIVAFRYGFAVLICGAFGGLAGRFLLRW